MEKDSSHPPKHDGGDIKKTALDNNSFNFMQVGRFALYGFMIAPVIHTWYSFLDKRFPLPAGVSTGIAAATEVSSSIKHINTNGFWNKLKRMNLQSLNAVIKRVAVDQIMFAPVGVGSFFIIISVLEGRNINEIKGKIDEAYLPALKANYTVWPLVQFINFRFLPLKYRVPFVSSVAPNHTRMNNSLLSEIKFSIQKYELKGRRVNSVYFGGLALPSTFNEILETISQECYLPIDAEITMEGNPTSTESTTLTEFLSTGINRISLGLQSLNSKDLKLLGRDHSVNEGIKALEMAKRIFGDQNTALEMASDHISLYELTVKAGTPIYNEVKLGKYTIPNSDIMADMYETTIQVTKEFGFEQYEVSNFERKGKYSKHNFGYWSGLDYLGAHGRIYDPLIGTRIRTYNILHPEEWMTQCEEIKHGLRKSTQMSMKDIKEELVLFGLRTKIGIPCSRFKLYSNNEQELEQFLNMEKVNNYVQDGFLIWDNKLNENSENDILSEFREELKDGRLRPTEKGLAVIDEIIPRILN
ncbi:3870_t:CDS:10 [Diversispora eburnea]|uniref:3870_t:CDS:1 n=1 Tax=Diversispora eburnea TaxID=1213867 RepID=A0A9N8VVX4_9GLOM|nr:3870_t:CDS:10 [Diversispora eburnea]